MRNPPRPLPGSVAGLLGWELVLRAVSWRKRPFVRIPPEELVPVGSLRDASAKCRAWMEKHKLSSGHWAGGQVRAGRGQVVAIVDSNGRITLPDGREYKL